ncbi:MAG: hypothetical protein IPM82_20040 [Saprospiraceae bacterium]|nr:hypothetical protein [Saprospiraceae bacterium]
MKLIHAIFLFVFLFHFHGYAQTIIRGNLKIGNPHQTQILKTVRGDRFIGSVMYIDSSGYFFRLKNKAIVHFESINVTSISVVKRKDLRPENAILEKSEHLMLLPTAFMLKKGEGEYFNQMLVFHSFNYGLTNKINAGVGLLALPSGVIGWSSVKSSLLNTRYANWSVGSLVSLGKDFNHDEIQDMRAFLPFTSFTIGHRKTYINFSFSKGIAGFEGEAREWTPLLYALGAKIDVGKKSGLSLEINNFFIDEATINYLIGYSHHGKKSALYLGFFIGDKDFLFPMCSYTRMLQFN